MDDPSPIDVNTRLARRMQIAQLTAQVDKLTRDHQRAKNPEQRNEIVRETAQDEAPVGGTARQ